MTSTEVKHAIITAWPIVLGYFLLGLPSGIMLSAVNFSPLQAGLLSLFVYSGAGQFMLSNMILTGIPLPTTLASIILVNARQMLYSSALVSYFKDTPAIQKFLAASNLTDETFGIGIVKLQSKTWSAAQTFVLNATSHSSWITANIVGAALGEALTVPTAIASFAMTSIFICLLMSQRGRADYIIGGFAAFVATGIFKFTPFSQTAILLGALVGVLAGLIAYKSFGYNDDHLSKAMKQEEN